MDTQTDERLRGLTEKERATLRLMLRGHDAKSIARSLGLSVHTVNERLRDARRKLEVSSSREAARLLFEAERAGEADPKTAGDTQIGADPGALAAHQPHAPVGGAVGIRPPMRVVGAVIMSLAIAVLAFATLSPSAPDRAMVQLAAAQTDPEVVTGAQQWLELLDQGRWEETYQGTGSSFRKMNSLKVWSEASEQARTPLGAMQSRTLLSQQWLPAPPAGYEVVKFSTRFANRPTPVVETVSLAREGNAWVVVGIMLD